MIYGIFKSLSVGHHSDIRHFWSTILLTPSQYGILLWSAFIDFMTNMHIINISRSIKRGIGHLWHLTKNHSRLLLSIAREKQPDIRNGSFSKYIWDKSGIRWISTSDRNIEYMSEIGRLILDNVRLHIETLIVISIAVLQWNHVYLFDELDLSFMNILVTHTGILRWIIPIYCHLHYKGV